MTIAERFLDVAEAHPEQLAVSDEQRSWTFGELAERSRALAGDLQRRGLAPSDRVVVVMENRAAYLQCLLASWIAGLCVVPVNVKLHVREVAYAVSDAGAMLCLTSSRVLDGGLAQALEHPDRVLSVDSDEFAAASSGPVSAEVGVVVADEAPAWIFYTSGTTGRPKGATLSSGSLLAMCRAFVEDVDAVEVGDTQLILAPFSHGAGLHALPHLLRGGHQRVVSGSFSPETVFAEMSRLPRVSMFLAPTMLHRMVEWAEGRDVEAAVANVATICYGGAPMYVQHLEAAVRVFPGHLYQIYGQGECPMTISGLRQADHHPGSARLRTAGQARSGVTVRVVDTSGRTLPTGEVGRILVSSDCLMDGYWDKPVETSETLVDGWLDTGDIGALDDEGYLTLSDRSKDVIISGGSNVYPREIEEVLVTHPSVDECSVISVPDEDWGELALAFVVAAPGRVPDPAALEQHCLDNLARFKRPRYYQVVDTLPKNSAGKVVKAELRARVTDGSVAAGGAR